MDYPIFVTYLILGITVLVSLQGFSDDSFKRKFLLNPNDVVQYKNWYRCFTHGFLHADMTHLAFNMFVLYMFGENIEEFFLSAYGARGYFLFSLLYLMGILFATVPALMKHKDNPGYNSLGASGAVSAVVFAFILLMPKAPLGLIFIPGLNIPAYIFGPLYLLSEYYLSKRGGTGIAHDAHIAGAVFGIIFITLVDYNYLFNFFTSIFS